MLDIGGNLVINDTSSPLVSTLTLNSNNASDVDTLIVRGDFSHNMGILSLNVFNNSNNPTTNRVMLRPTPANAFDGDLQLTLPTTLDVFIESNRFIMLNFPGISSTYTMGTIEGNISDVTLSSTDLTFINNEAMLDIASAVRSTPGALMGNIPFRVFR